MNESSESRVPTLKELREKAGLTQESLARAINKSFRTVGDWETGKSIPRLDNAIEAAKALRVSLDTLARSLGLSPENPDSDIESEKG